MTDPWDGVQPIGSRPTGAPAPHPAGELDTTPRSSDADARTTSTPQHESPRTGEPSAAVVPRASRASSQVRSAQELARRRYVNGANRGAGTGREPERNLAKHRARPPRRGNYQQRATHSFTAEELLGKVTTLGRKFYAIADDPDERPITRKYATTSFSILVDKWTIVNGAKSSLPADFTSVARDGVLELAARLAEAARESA